MKKVATWIFTAVLTQLAVSAFEPPEEDIHSIFEPWRKQLHPNVFPIALYNISDISHDDLHFIIDDMIFSGRHLRHNYYCARRLYPFHVCEAFDKSKIWRMPIKYKFVRSLRKEHIERLNVAIRRFEESTCIRFREAKDSDDQSEVLKIYPTGGSCGAHVGFEKFKSYMSLGPECFQDDLRKLEHELFHVLGVEHEHSRPIRDDYVTIIEKNIKDNDKENFQKENDSLPDSTPHNYGSIMHYSAKAFAKTLDAITIMPKESMYVSVMGQRQEVTFNDWKKINSAYCADRCTGTHVCYNSGYPNPNDCSVCLCPLVSQSAGCHGMMQSLYPPVCPKLYLLPTRREVTAYFEPDGSGKGSMCLYKIETFPVNRIVYGKVESDKKDAPSTYLCQDSYVEVRFKADRSVSGPRYCGGSPLKFTSESNIMFIIVVRDPGDTTTYEISYKST